MTNKTAAQSIDAALVPDALLTVQVVAQLAGVKPRTIWEWVHDGRHGIPKPKRYGRKMTRWRAQEITDWLRETAQAL